MSRTSALPRTALPKEAAAASPSAEAPAWLPALLAVAAAGATLAAYSNHFHNSFHFDDASVIVNNVYLRDLKNIPLFFRDGKTFSSIPANAAYRPLTAVSLALDWRWGGGANHSPSMLRNGRCTCCSGR